MDDKRDEIQRKVVVAKRGKIVADEVNHTISLLLADGVVHESLDGRYTRTEFNSNSMSVNPAELRDTKKGSPLVRSTCQLSGPPFKHIR